ncbi:MAG: hypothetical protein WBM44_23950 [Waterburya sp.]
MARKEIIITEQPRQNVTYIENTDRDLFHLLCNCEDYWFSYNLLYDSYAKLEYFNRFKIKLLYFQVGAFELDAGSGEIWKAFDFSDSRAWADLKRINLDFV